MGPRASPAARSIRTVCPRSVSQSNTVRAASDARALTLIYYLNPTWAPDHAGEFFAVGAGWDFERRKVEPRGDRLVAFDSRTFFHSVDPAVVKTPAETRFALTLWLESPG